MRLVQLLAKVAVAQVTAKIRKGLLAGMPARQAQSAPSVGMMADEVTPADHMIAFAMGLAICMEVFSVCTPKKGKCSNTQRRPAG